MLHYIFGGGGSVHFSLQNIFFFCIDILMRKVAKYVDWFFNDKMSGEKMQIKFSLRGVIYLPPINQEIGAYCLHFSLIVKKKKSHMVLESYGLPAYFM